MGNCSYNQLVEKIITQKNSAEESQVTEGINVYHVNTGNMYIP